MTPLSWMSTTNVFNAILDEDESLFGWRKNEKAAGWIGIKYAKRSLTCVGTNSIPSFYDQFWQ